MKTSRTRNMHQCRESILSRVGGWLLAQGPGCVREPQGEFALKVDAD